MIAAKKAMEDAGELDKLRRQLAYKESYERYEIWMHRQMMMQRAARLRMLERQRTESRNSQERLKTEMEAKLREAKKRNADEARKAAEAMKEQMEEAELKRNEVHQRTEDARQRAAVKAAVEKAILDQQALIKIKEEADDIQEK